MIAFEVHRNGEKICTAGVSDGVLTAILTWLGSRKQEEGARQGTVARTLDLHVGGLQAAGMEAGQHLRWHDDALKPGDSVLIRVIESAVVDSPVSREPQDPEVAEEAERIVYEGLRKKYGDSGGSPGEQPGR